MKKAIKLTLSLCTAMSLFSMTAFADISAGITEKKVGNFEITVDNPTGDERYQIWVGKSGVKEDRLAAISDEDDFMDCVRHVDAAVAKNNDPLTIEVDLSGTAEYGKYVIRLIKTGMDVVEDTYLLYKYYNENLAEIAIPAFRAVENADDFVEALETYTDEANEFIPKEELGVVADEDIASIIGDNFVRIRDYKYPEGEAFATGDDVLGCIRAAYALTLLLGDYSEDAAEKIEEYGSFVSEIMPEKENAEATMVIVSAAKKFIVDGQTLGEVLSVAKKYGADSDENTVKAFEKNKSNIKKTEDVETVSKWAYILGKLAGAKRSEIEEIITDNEEFLGIDTSADAHHGVSLAKVAQRFDTSKAMSLYGKDAFGKYYNSIAEDIYDSTEDKKGSSSSRKVSTGGGGVSSGKTIYPNAVEMVPIDNETAPQQQDVIGLPFKDIDGCAWAHEFIKALYDKDIVKGVTEDTFEPDRAVTREEFVKMLAVAFELETDKNMIFDFTDVTIDMWSYPYIETAFRAGIVRGKTNDYFGRTETITRQDAAVMISRIIGAASDDEPGFADTAAISDYALSAVSGVSERGIIVGDADGNFNPTAVTTRAQAATIIARAIEGGNAE